MRKLFLSIFCLFGSLVACAQEFGGNPPSVRWMQINTDSLRIIFPKGFAPQAQKVVNTALYMNRHNRASIGNKEIKLNIILQDHTVESNGFVALAPFRSVFETTPPADNFSLGTINWIQELTLHEYWHALQNMNFRSGIGRTFYDLFGENGQAFITQLLIPNWYWEGDAVFMETALSHAGRGRLPSFLEPFKSLYYAGEDYSYPKILNGSLHDLVPNDYVRGYMMTAYGRDTFGFSFWKTITQEALLNQKFIKQEKVRSPGNPFHWLKYGLYPFASALNYHTGTKTKGFYHRSLSHFENYWQAEREEQNISDAITLKKNNTRSVLSYRYPHLLPDGKILAVKSGYAFNPKIIEIDSAGMEKEVVKMGNIQDSYFSYGGNKLVWTEFRQDIRWGWKNYSVIRLHDMGSGKTNTLTHKSRYFSPSLSADGKEIVTVEVPPDGRSRLVILNTETGKISDSLLNPAHYYYTYPVFTDSSRAIIAAIRDSAGRMALIKQNINQGNIIFLTPFILKPFGPPVVSKDYIFFPAAFTNNIQLYAFSKKEGKIYRIATRPLGNYSLAPDTVKARIVFDEFTANGYRLCQMPLSPEKWEQVNPAGIKKIADPYVAKALKAAGGPILNNVPDQTYPVTRYRRGKHLFKVHSWSFLPDYPDIGVYLQSQDLLGTLSVNAGGGYNLSEKTPFISAYALYGGWFPFLKAGFKEIFDRNGYLSGTANPVSWNESNVYAGLDIPLDLSGSLYHRIFTIGATINQNSLHFRPGSDLKKNALNIQYLDGSLSFSNARLMPVQGIYPKFGQGISFRYRQTIDEIYARQFTASLNLFFPGFYPNHSFYVNSNFSIKDDKKEYRFSEDFKYANGYEDVPYQKIYHIGVNYQLPLAYPDWGLTFAYILRLRLHLFFDYSRAKLLPGIHPSEATFRSAGGTFYLDTKLLNLPVPIGVRYSYLLDKDLQDPGRKSRVELSFPITFY